LGVAKTRIDMDTTYKSVEVDKLSIFYRDAGSPDAHFGRRTPRRKLIDFGTELHDGESQLGAPEPLFLDRNHWYHDVSDELADVSIGGYLRAKPATSGVPISKAAASRALLQLGAVVSPPGAAPHCL
jgi:hypothetical protein